ncbi:Lrp/AsnC ligand binding domain-containing protein [Leptolyngbya sp. PCC 6406]|uniref:Lrp/AsnC ligand binding domain-containing protein n=1 Tax=Leptolyngbya sp. PCC 6406 TaxID=1173264 RepID=UPI0002D9C335|nr:Lrp/AsnC ligand binding domain-containing protein [Leptolyngbya sp. PCC 6406]
MHSSHVLPSAAAPNDGAIGALWAQCTQRSDDYLLKVRCQGTRGLEALITHGLKQIPGVHRTRTTIVLSSIKETIALPV